jgi:transcriptional regulator with XRE-family HTH domain
MRLPENIKQVRIKWKLGQKEFGAIFGVKDTQISSYERGESEPSISFLIKLCHMTRIDAIRIVEVSILTYEIPDKPIDYLSEGAAQWNEKREAYEGLTLAGRAAKLKEQLAPIYFLQLPWEKENVKDFVKAVTEHEKEKKIDAESTIEERLERVENGVAALRVELEKKEGRIQELEGEIYKRKYKS